LKRGKLEKHLNKHDCVLHRNGSKHDIFRNTATSRKTTIPRHPDIDEMLCKEICKQLGIPKP